MKWVIVSPLLFLALVGHLLTLYVGVSIIHQCLTTGTFRRSSGLPLVGPLFLILAFIINRAWTVLWIAGVLLALELLLGIVTNIVMRKTNSKPRSS
jgi:hypothetical protein